MNATYRNSKRTDMQVTPELIEKYHNGQCTLGERQVVEAWLHTEEPVDLQAIPGVKEERLKKEIWAGVAQHLKNARRLRISRAGRRVAAAASISGVMVLLKANPFFLSRTIVIHNSGATAQTFTVKHLQLNIMPDSRCIVHVPLLESRASIRFCGAVSVTSNTRPVVTVDITTDNQDCEGRGADKIKLYNGETYMAMTDGEYNMIAATGKELKDGLPRLFSSRLSERFKL